jgi:glycosyltransferase involved in cell wall biosynthesis
MAYYNTPLPLVHDALASLADQTASNFELILANDFSNPACARGVELLLSKVPFRCKHVCLSRNSGPAAARNAAAAVAEGDYLLVLDSDDRLEPQAIQLFTAHALLTRAAYIFSDHRKYDVTLTRTIQTRTKQGLFNLHKEYKATLYDPLLYFKFTGAAEAFHKDAFASAGGYTPGCVAEDWDLAHRISRLSNDVNFAHIPEFAYKYRESPNGASHSHPGERFVSVAFDILHRSGHECDYRFQYPTKLQPYGNTVFGIVRNGSEVHLPYIDYRYGQLMLRE